MDSSPYRPMIDDDLRMILEERLLEIDLDKTGLVAEDTLRQLLAEHIESHDLENMLQNAKRKDELIDYQEFLRVPPLLHHLWIEGVERLFGLEFTAKERELMVHDLLAMQRNYSYIHGFRLENSARPALFYSPQFITSTPYTQTATITWDGVTPMNSSWSVEFTVVIAAGDDTWIGPLLWVGTPDNGFQFNIAVYYTFMAPKV